MIIKKILKYLFFSIIGLLIITSIIIYVNLDYKMYPLKANQELYSKNIWEIDTDSLAEELLKRMTLEEKIDQMYGEKMYKSIPKFFGNFIFKQRFPHIYVGRNERLNIPPWVLSDGPRGARVLDKNVRGVTTFPVAMARAASWNTKLEYEVHDVISKEMRANKTNYAATPCINLLRHPGWGRAQETYGEDPWLLGEFGVAAIKGIEKNNVMACPKHFALNSIENSRWVIDVSVDERTLREVYLPHFRKVIKDGKPASIMSAYNKVRGKYSGSNEELLTNILKNDWGFNGFISTDWMYGIYNGVEAINAGLNVEMPWQDEYSYNTIRNGLEEEKITLKDIDELVLSTLKTRLKYAFSYDSIDYNHELILNKSHVNLAREVAEESMVLIKNENILPFDLGENLKIGVIGRLADTENTGDLGSSNSNPPYVVTPFQGIKNYHINSNNKVYYDEAKDINKSVELAKDLDQVILVVGYDYSDEGEYIMSRGQMLKSAEAKKLIGAKGVGGDRLSLKLRDKDEILIKEISKVNDNIVVVYIGGSAIDMNSWESNVPSIIFSWYSGMEGGNALAKIIYGDINPSGKLPFTIAKNSNDYPYFNPYTDTITYGYYHGYSLFEKYKKDIEYPFGHGLSYSKFKYENFNLVNYNPNDSILNFSVDLTNVSNIEGKEISQLYVGFENSEIDRPLKLLRGFKKIHLKPEEKKTISFQINKNDLSYYNTEKKKWLNEKISYNFYVGGSSQSEKLLKITKNIY
ncbi:MAG: glycosyl hydrolase [Flammeovirgaceae bacterium]|nr:glycosyl hydrolase [Flammeovirgaceae bacterium]